MSKEHSSVYFTVCRAMFPNKACSFVLHEQLRVGRSPQREPHSPCQVAASRRLSQSHHVSLTFAASHSLSARSPAVRLEVSDSREPAWRGQLPFTSNLEKQLRRRRFATARLYTWTGFLPHLVGYEATAVILGEKLKRMRRRLITSLEEISQVSFHLLWCPWRKDSHNSTNWGGELASEDLKSFHNST